jgi:hypothetical protein
MRLILLAALVLSLAACAPAPATESPWEPLPTLPPTTPLADGVLIDYAVEGGVAFSRIAVTVRQDGAARLVDAQYSGALNWTAPAELLGRLKSLLLNSSLAFLDYDPAPNLSCADCLVYTVNALTPQGVKTLHFNEAAINQNASVSPRYKELVAVMTDVINSAPRGTALPPTAPDTPGPAITPPPQTPLPPGALIVFTLEGGLAFTSKIVTVYPDGTAHLVATTLTGPVDWTVPAEQVSPLKDLLISPEFAALAYTPNSGVNCSDCYVMKAEALTPVGQKSLMFTEADIDFAPGTPPLYKKLFDIMNAIFQSAPAPAGTGFPAGTATPPIPHEAEALPPDVLLVYNRQGGFAYSNLTLTVRLNGAAVLTSGNAPAREFMLAGPDMAALKALLAEPALARLPGGRPSACADCYVYTVTARTPAGIVLLKADDASLSNGQWGPYQNLLKQLSSYLK